ncbi:uncharacterized protein LOC117182541 [Belonocnema kinseyi]|uniref:uncharacterized protein LOC117182541 n=1 Tax=Belonocnema kinseyi TaxID=2817044 RepID=UPI00143D5129|nr:uncharacterized protein LOC117182541 [Belonocnema kinseyi]
MGATFTNSRSKIDSGNCFVAMADINELKLELFLRSPYSPDLISSDYLRFPNLKKWLGGKKVQINEEVIDAVNEYFEGLGESVYQNGITALEHRYEKFFSLESEYVEK